MGEHVHCCVEGEFAGKVEAGVGAGFYGEGAVEGEDETPDGDVEDDAFQGGRFVLGLGCRGVGLMEKLGGFFACGGQLGTKS